MTDKYQKIKAGGNGGILGMGNLGFNFEGTKKCPDGYTWVRGYDKKVGLLTTVHVEGHCRKISDGPEEIRRKVSVF